MSLRAVHLLPAVCPDEEGGTGGPPGRPICPGRGPPAPRRRSGLSAGWRWDPGNGVSGVPHLPGQAPGDPPPPAHAPSLAPAGRLPTTAPVLRIRLPISKDTSISIFSVPYSVELCRCVERKRRDPSDFKGPLVWLSCHPYR